MAPITLQLTEAPSANYAYGSSSMQQPLSVSPGGAGPGGPGAGSGNGLASPANPYITPGAPAASPNGGMDQEEDDLSSDAGEPQELTLEEVLLSLKNGLFGVLFVIIKESRVPPLMVVLLMVVDVLQIFNFPFNVHVGFKWPNAEWFVQFLEIWTLDEQLLVTEHQTAFTLFASLLGVVFANALYVGFSFYRGHIRWLWTLRTLRSVLNLCCTVFYIPILNSFTKVLINCKDDAGVVISCWSGSALVVSVSALVLGILFMMLTFMVTATFFEQEPGGKDVLSRPHARIDVAHLLIRTYLTILFMIFKRGSEEEAHLHPLLPWQTWLLVGSLVVLSTVITGLFAWFPPYYQFKYSLLQTCLMAAWSYACWCLLYLQIRPNEELGILYFLTVPIVVALVAAAQFSRRRWLLAADISQLSDSLSIELKTRFHLAEKGLLFKMQDVELSDQPLTDLSLFNRVKDISVMYTDAVKRMPDSALLHLFWAEFYLLFLRNRHMALTNYARVESKSTSFDVQFLVFRRRKLLSENFAGDAINFIAYEQFLSLATRYERRVTLNQTRFWAELLRKSVDIARLHKLAAAISKEITITQDNYVRVLKLNPNSPQVLRVYANFLIEVLNDVKLGRELQERADDLDDDDDGDGNGDGEDSLDLDLFSEDNMVLTISGVPESIGQIVQVNNLALKTLGYKKTELMGRNIASIIPEPFATPHDEYLLRYLETGFSKIVERTRKVLCVTKQGYLLPVMLMVKQVAQKNRSTGFLGVMRVLPPTAEDYILMNGREEVTGFSPGITQWFGVTPPPRVLTGATSTSTDGASTHQPMHVSEILPRYAEMKEQYFGRAGAVVSFTTKKGVPPGKPGYKMNAEVQISHADIPAPDASAAVRMTMAAVLVFKPDADDSMGPPPLITRSRAALNDMGEDSPVTSSRSLRRTNSGQSTALSQRKDMPMGFMDEAEFDSKVPGVGTAPRRRRSIVHRSANDAMSDTESQSGGGGGGGGARRGASDARSKASSMGGGAQSPDHVKNVLVRKNVAISNRLRWLRYSFLAIMALLIALAVRSYWTTTSLYRAYQTRLQQITLEHAVALDAVSLAYGVRTLDLAASGLANTTAIAWARNDIAAHATSVAEIATELAALLPATDYYTQYFAGGITVDLVTRLATGIKTTPVGLLDAANALESTAEQIIASTGAPLRRFVDLLMDNAPAAVPAAFVQHTDGFNADFEQISGSLRLEVIVSILPVVLYVVTVLLLIRPVYGAIQREKDHFLYMFRAIPRHVVRAIHEQWQRRFEKLTGDTEQDAGDMPFRTESPMTAVNPPSGGGSFRDTGKPGFDVTDRLVSAASGAAAGNESLMFLAPRQSTGDAETGVGAALHDLASNLKRACNRKYSMLFFLTLAYFLAASLMAYSFQRTALSRGYEVKWSTRLPYLSRQLTFYLREAAVPTNASTGVTVYQSAAECTAKVAALSAQLTALDQGLMYGSNELGLDGFAGFSLSAISSLFLTSACASGSPADCTTFNQGVMKNGLHTVFREFRALVDQALVLLQSGGITTTEVVTTPPFSTLWALDYVYLPATFEAMSQQYVMQSTQALNQFYLVYLVLTIIYAVLLVGLYVLYYRAHITQLGTSAMRTHVMLFLIPIEVINNVESIQRYLRS
ncbi:PAS domain S-box protein [Allomyces macrogynus ATCC 38327]|uniref:PAS domain S-box protein n=1 Tax=Allomyces macrogynus (strain ATCC 38327) TaxID=578462 RepID=A0A0L0SV41_ALLM3|nr:PAS domain S-box protein [Allomyces macrogynus ATCC 38327]|eukprot:KNE66443.1 PAS domain S-box protein [Allomyces macrogynus ATCC 38327]